MRAILGRAMSRTATDASTASIPAVTTAVPDTDEKTYAQGIPLLFARYTLPEDGGTRKARVDHSGTTGKQFTLKTVLTDVNGTSVTQVVTRAHDVR